MMHREEAFRSMLDKGIKEIDKYLETGGYDTKALHYGRSLLVQTKTAFDELFPNSKELMTDIASLMKEYCESDKTLCPVCSSKLIKRTNRKTQKDFLGCSSYPKCKGSRHLDGNPSINDGMLEFLDKIAQKELKHQKRLENSRFAKIEYE